MKLVTEGGRKFIILQDLRALQTQLLIDNPTVLLVSGLDTM